MQPLPSGAAHTVWTEKTSWIDTVPRPVSMGLLFVLFIFFWTALTWSEFISPIILPSPAETLKEIIFVGHNLLIGDYMLAALHITLQEVFYSFLLALFLGFSLGVLVGETLFGERAVMPYLVALDTMPKVVGEISYTCKKCGFKHKNIEISGLQDFLT
jgi:NitT/TauT family transport system permease protein